MLFSLYFPLFHSTSTNFQTLFQVSPKFATEAPILGSPFKTDTLYSNINLGFDFSFSTSIEVFGKSSLYYYIRPAYIWGSKPYKVSLTVDENFLLVQHTIGIDITNVARIGFTLPPMTNVEVLKSNIFLLTLQLSPQNVIK